MNLELQKLDRELAIKNYSPRTRKSYAYALREYFSFKCGNYTHLDEDDIRDFLKQCEQKKLSAQSRNLFLNAIKFYFRKVVENLGKIQIQSAKKPKNCRLS